MNALSKATTSAKTREESESEASAGQEEASFTIENEDQSAEASYTIDTNNTLDSSIEAKLEVVEMKMEPPEPKIEPDFQ
jgi:hypothetical protein